VEARVKLIQLNIRYDQEYPFDWVPQVEHYEKMYGGKPPIFLYNRGKIKVLGFEFTRRRRCTGGFDPYAGEEWTGICGRLEIRMSNLICASAQVTFRGKVLVDRRKYEWREMPWYWDKLWDFLKHRYAWWEYNSLQVEDYDIGSYYE
jgi:hypothetical protein